MFYHNQVFDYAKALCQGVHSKMGAKIDKLKKKRCTGYENR
jgi:hypothetical protein